MATDTLDRVSRWIADADRVVALTGAGVSTDSGIPDFRGPQGLWTKDPTAERRATIDAWRQEPDLRRDAWRFRLATRDLRFEPSAAHRALAELQRLNRLDLLVTQNIDGLHQQAGANPARLVEVHGNAREVVCLGCGHRQPLEHVLDRVAAGETDPHCLDCGGVLKSATISFGQALVDADLVRAKSASETADVFLAVGTSLAVYPVAWLPMMAKRRGARLGDPQRPTHRAGRRGRRTARSASSRTLLPPLVDRVRQHLGA